MKVIHGLLIQTKVLNFALITIYFVLRSLLFYSLNITCPFAGKCSHTFSLIVHSKQLLTVLVFLFAVIVFLNMVNAGFV